MSKHQHPFDAVMEFHRAFNLPIDALVVGQDAAQLRDLRIDLLAEEWDEYERAEANDDISEIADALADIIYIALGTAIAYGIPMKEVFAEVHRSNMSKLEDGKPIYYESGKVAKGPSYTPPDIASILQKGKQP